MKLLFSAILYLSFFSILIPQNLCAQTFIEYNKLVSRAENQIVKGDILPAFNSYIMAFENIHNPFAHDIYNAALCSSELKNDSMTFILLKLLLNKGISLKHCKSKYFSNFKNSKYWPQLMSFYKSLDHDTNLNPALYQKLAKLEQRDQAIRKRKYGYPLSDTIKQVDSLNLVELMVIFDQYGYPDENIIGIKNPMHFRPPQYIVIRHQYQFRNFELSPFLKSQVDSGRLDPRVFAELEDKKSMYTSKSPKYGTVAFYKIKSHIIESNFSDGQIALLDQNRKNIGLESWTEYKNKVKFQIDQKKYYFGITEGLVILKGISLSEFQGNNSRL